MSRRSRARYVASEKSWSYQFALQNVIKVEDEAKELARKMGWPLKQATLFFGKPGYREREEVTMTWYWCSFADEEFLGAVIVEGKPEPDLDPGDLCKKCWRLGINPGGEVAIFEIDDEIAERIPKPYLNTLLTLSQCQGLDALMGGDGLIKGSADNISVLLDEQGQEDKKLPGEAVLK
jgi:hypothetical protein